MSRRLMSRVVCLIIVFTGFNVTNAQQESTKEENANSTFQLINPQADRLTGNWGGLRDRLEAQGIKWSLYTNVYYGVNAKGGLKTDDAQRVSESTDLFGQLDFERMHLIDGGQMLLHVKDRYRRNIDPFVGAVSDPIDDADGNRNLYIAQFWYQQNLIGSALQLRLGYLDQQTMLDRNAYANSEDKQFMATYLDNDNAIVPLAIGLGASLFVNPTDWLSFVIGGADAEADPLSSGFRTTFNNDRDFFGYFESDVKLAFDSEQGSLPGNYRFGLVFDPRNRGTFADPAKRENADVGFYMSFDQALLRESSASAEGLSWFARYGFRHEDVNKINNFWSTGLQYAGLLAGREADVIGLGMYQVDGSDDYRHYVNSDFDQEAGYEFYYSIQLTPNTTLTPDIQYIHQPGAAGNIDDAVILALRLRMTY